MSFDPRLGALFVFTAEDLAANRAGRLSDEQRTTVAAGIRGLRRGLGRGRVLITVAVLVGAAATLAMSRSPGGGGGGLLPLGLAGAVLLIIFTAVRLAQRSWSRTVDATAASTLRTTEGTFDWTTTVDQTWIGTIGAARFSIDRAHLAALDGGGRFSVHYLPWRGDLAWVMSMERIDGS